MALPTSLRLPADLPLEAWLRIGGRLQSTANPSAWWAGDWLIHGSTSYPGRYREAIAGTALGYQTLRNYAWVARKFEPGRRRADLSFQHHQEVAAFPPEEQERWLDRATAAGWPRSELRRRLRGHSVPVVTRLRFDLPDDRWEAWQQAARRADTDLPTWLTRLADRAAAQA
ncbi:hypothetical protein ADK52_30825 [Streptomyces sp. WM6372]|nr:hypothetical protein ADK52_30825 [Streptomyces sp. WM6372]